MIKWQITYHPAPSIYILRVRYDVIVPALDYDEKCKTTVNFNTVQKTIDVKLTSEDIINAQQQGAEYFSLYIFKEVNYVLVDAKEPKSVCDYVASQITNEITQKYYTVKFVDDSTYSYKITGIYTSKYYTDVVEPGPSSNRMLSTLSKRLPGVKEKVATPCNCHVLPNASVWEIIQHLNDNHSEWTREKIADWLDELHDTGQVNIEFQVDVEGGE